jgi:hypothetical protein
MDKATIDFEAQDNGVVAKHEPLPSKGINPYKQYECGMANSFCCEYLKT